MGSQCWSSNMIRILLWGCVLYRAAFVLTASINMDATDKDIDEYKDIEEEYNEKRATNPRSRVLFEEDEVNEHTESSATNFNAGNEKLDLSRKLSLVIPDSINMNATEEYYDEYQYSDAYDDKDEENSEERATNPRSRVLFEDDEVNEETKANAINFNAGNDKLDRNRKGLDWKGLDWKGLDWIGKDWKGLDWKGLDWKGMDGKGYVRQK